MATKRSLSTFQRLGRSNLFKHAAFGIAAGIVIQSVFEGVSTLYFSDRIESLLDARTTYYAHTALVTASIAALTIYQQKKGRSSSLTALSLCGVLGGYIFSLLLGTTPFILILPPFRTDLNLNLIGYLINMAVLALGFAAYYPKKNVYAGLSVVLGIRIAISIALLIISAVYSL